MHEAKMVAEIDKRPEMVVMPATVQDQVWAGLCAVGGGA